MTKNIIFVDGSEQEITTLDFDAVPRIGEIVSIPEAYFVKGGSDFLMQRYEVVGVEYHIVWVPIENCYGSQIYVVIEKLGKLGVTYE